MAVDYNAKSISGMLWTFLEKGSVQILQFVVYVILARYLTPRDFGVVGLLAIFIALSQVFVESGFFKALIQKTNRTAIDFETVFSFNTLLAVVLYSLLFAIAPFVAHFFEEEVLVILLRVLGLTVVFNSFSIVQRAKMAINFEFKTLAKINFIAFMISGTLSVLSAIFGYGMWALVVLTIGKAAISMVLFIYYSKWLPKFGFSQDSFKSLWNYGSKLLAASTIAVLYKNIYSLFIGKYYSVQSLGYFANAKKLADTPAGFIASSFQTVTFPVLSSLQEQKEEFLVYFMKASRVIVIMTLPIMLLILVLAEPIVAVLLTEKWMPMVPLLQLFCLSRVFTPINTLNMNVLNAIGRSDLFLKLDLYKLLIIIVVLFFTVGLSLEALVAGQVFVSFISFFINAYYPGKLLNYGIGKQAINYGMIVLISIITAIVVYFAVCRIDNNYIMIFVGSLFFFILIMILFKAFKIEEFLQVKNRIANKLTFFS